MSIFAQLTTPGGFTLIVIISLTMVGCTGHPPTVDRRSKSGVRESADTVAFEVDGIVYRMNPSKLVQAAIDTQSAFNRTGLNRTTGHLIPRECWASDIRRLNPRRIYTHYLNTVVVLAEKSDLEQGLYLYNPISSYALSEGNDGFGRIEKVSGVLIYERTPHFQN